MSINQRAAHCTPEAVFAVLSDGWLYAAWVVGASRIRDVDEAWPAVGAKVHHSVGAWPLLLDDHTEVLESEAPSLLQLRARAWPAGEATVTIKIDPTPAGCMITIEEQATGGPAKFIPNVVEDALLSARNNETLARLAAIAEGRAVVDPTHPAR